MGESRTREVDVLSGRATWTCACVNYPSHILTASHPARDHHGADATVSGYSSAKLREPVFILT